MKFHWPSFLIGAAVGATGAVMWTRFKPLLLELATAGYELGDALWARLAGVGEDAEDLLAEAQTRARAHGARVRAARTPTARTRTAAGRTARTRARGAAR